jgi:hypothetical protein
MSTPLFFLYFPYQNNPTRHGQGDPTIGRPGDQPEDIQLDNHLHSWLAKPTTLRLCQRRAPTVRMLISYIGPPVTPQTTLQQSRLTGGPAHRPPYLCLYFPLVNTRPVPLLSGSLPLFLHDIMPMDGAHSLIFPFTQQRYSASQSLHLGHSSYRAIISWGLAAASILVHYCGLSPQSPILYFTCCG